MTGLVLHCCDEQFDSLDACSTTVRHTIYSYLITTTTTTTLYTTSSQPNQIQKPLHNTSHYTETYNTFNLQQQLQHQTSTPTLTHDVYTVILPPFDNTVTPTRHLQHSTSSLPLLLDDLTTWRLQQHETRTHTTYGTNLYFHLLSTTTSPLLTIDIATSDVPSTLRHTSNVYIDNQQAPSTTSRSTLI